jgi:DNA-binding SARP family transcriptional activator/Tfp pilus assembly protein PilF
MLWPEADQPGGRHALRNALHGIRQALGDVVITAGGELVGVHRKLVSCDAIALEDDITAGRLPSALERYAGELLQGFHVADAPEFERWLDAERQRLHQSVFQTAVMVAERSRAGGDLDAALMAARQAMVLAPGDEATLRRLMELLGANGDRAGALREYDRFAARAREEYGFRPSAATLELAQSFRARAMTPLQRIPDTNDRRAIEDAPSPVTTAASTSTAQEPKPAPTLRGRGPRSRWLGLAAIPAVVVAAFAFCGWPSLRAAAGTGGTRAVIGVSNAATTAQLGALLPERYRADTSLARRYLAAEADLQGGRLKSARQSFQGMADEAPQFAPAWAGLSFAMVQSAFNEIPPSIALPRALAAARRALALDSTLVEAHRTVIAEAMFGRWDLPEAKRLLDAALARNPNDPELNNLLGTWHRWRGEHDAAIQLKKNAVAINPLSGRYANQIGSSLYVAHRCAEAVDVFSRVPEEQRWRLNQNLTLYRSLKCAGRRDEAAIALRESLLAAGDSSLAGLLTPPLQPARRDSAIRAVFRARLNENLAQRREHWRSSAATMVLYAELENRDSTLIWLDSMYVERAMMLHVVPFDPLMDFLREDRRFGEFVGRLPWRKVGF